MDGATLEKLNLLVNFGLPLVVLMLAYLVGAAIEARHFQRIRRREGESRNYPVVTFDTMPADWDAAHATLVAGNIVISLDYFKRVIAGLRALVGGRVKTYEPLLDRARREALLRMVEQARALGYDEQARDQGYDAVFNVRLETSRLANSSGDGNRTAGVEMLAFGTAVKLRSRFEPRPERF